MECIFSLVRYLEEGRARLKSRKAPQSPGDPQRSPTDSQTNLSLSLNPIDVLAG